MPVASVTNTLEANQLARASDLNRNFSDLVDLLNTGLDNMNIAGGAAIDASKIANGSVSNAEFQHLNGVTSSIQTQIDNVSAGVPTIDGAASTIISDNLTASRAVISDTTGKINVSGVTSTELSRLSGVTSSVQTQLNSKASTSTTITGTNGLTGGGSLSTNRTIEIAPSGVTPARTTFLSSSGANAAIFVGRVNSAGTALRLPSGWSSTRLGVGRYRVTHNLGTTGYVVIGSVNIEEAQSAAPATVEIEPHESNIFEYRVIGMGAQSPVNVDLPVNFILHRY